MAFAPFVSGKGLERTDWERYAAENGREWIARGQADYLASQGEAANFVTPVPPVPSRIHPVGQPDVASPDDADGGRYLPVWQISPPPNATASMVNANLLGSNGNGNDGMIPESALKAASEAKGACEKNEIHRVGQHESSCCSFFQLGISLRRFPRSYPHSARNSNA